MIDPGDLAARVGPVLAFLIAITVVAELADAAGVFDAAAVRAARLSGGSTVRLWLLVVALACASTIVLSLDTCAVLLTPVVLALARRARLNPLPFAFTTVWLANTASLLLPVSNLTNLLALHRFDGTVDYLHHAWAPALAAIGATVAVSAVLFGRRLRGRFETVATDTPGDRALLLLASAVCMALGPAFVSGLAPWISATVAAVILLAATGIRAPAALCHIELPWRTVLLAAVLFVGADVVDAHGGRELFTTLLGSSHGGFALARVAGVAGLAANAVNNLPAYLALDGATGAETSRVVALLVGVNVLPIITPWGSLATLLWHERCRRAGVRIGWGRYVAMSALVALVAGAASLLALVATI